jgi:hypothetical protein
LGGGFDDEAGEQAVAALVGKPFGRQGSAVGLFAVAHLHDDHQFRRILDLVQNAVVALANAVFLCAAELLAAMWSCVAREQLDLRDDTLTIGDLGLSAARSTGGEHRIARTRPRSSASFDPDAVASAAAWDAVGADIFAPIVSSTPTPRA